MLLITNHDFYNKQDTTTFSRRTDSGPQQNGLQLNRRAHINIFFVLILTSSVNSLFLNTLMFNIMAG